MTSKSACDAKILKTLRETVSYPLHCFCSCLIINRNFFVPSSCSLRGSSYTLLHVPFLLPAQTLEIAIIEIIVAPLQYSKLSWNIKPYLRICSQWVSEWEHSKWVPWGSWQGSQRPSCPPSLPGSPKLAAEAPWWPAARYNVKSRKQERWWWRVDTQPEITVEELQSLEKIGVQAMFPSCFPAIKRIWIWREKKRLFEVPAWELAGGKAFALVVVLETTLEPSRAARPAFHI